jgi:hypothetical protein
MAGRQGWNEAESRYHSIDWHNLTRCCWFALAGCPSIAINTDPTTPFSITRVVLLSQKVAADGEENHLFGKIHTSAMGRLEWVCRDQTMVKRDFRPMLRG